MARSWLQRLPALSLLVTPVQSLQSSPSRWQLPAVHVSYHSHPSGWAAPLSGNAAPIRGDGSGNRRRFSTGRLRATASEIGADEDFDEFFEELSEASALATDTEAAKEGMGRSHFIEGEAAIGIGGNDGFVYDVNKLKRNLVQESVRDSKQELLILLGDGRQYRANSKQSPDNDKQKIIVPPRWRRDRDDLIEERLSALVQANPVSTTTDSNLLDGEWSFAFQTNSASTILDTRRFLLSKTKRPAEEEDESQDNTGNAGSTVRGGPWRFRSGKTENPFRSSTREIYLENLSGDENAHVIDETRVLGGLFQISRRYDVFGLTRTAIDLDLTESESRLFGFVVNSKGSDEIKGTNLDVPLEIQVLYLDTDLCICTTGAGLDGPLHVYTKSDLWVTGGAKRKLRLIAKTGSWISTLQSPLRIRQRLANMISKKKENKQLVAGPGLKSVNIGEVDIDSEGKTKEDPAWDGPDDPFLHLSPGERMQVLKQMSLQDIYQSAAERKEQNKKQKKKWIASRGKKFKRPDI